MVGDGGRGGCWRALDGKVTELSSFRSRKTCMSEASASPSSLPPKHMGDSCSSLFPGG